MFGNNVKVMIYSSWLQSDTANHGILGDPEGFASRLRELFGIAGATVEVLFVREIRKRFVNELGLTLPPNSESFPSLVREIRLAGKTEPAT
jgi:hypothetical protein